jgi:alkylhydroperoxidase family enzyme
MGRSARTSRGKRSSAMADDRKRLFRFWADGYQALHRLSELVKASGLESSLLELVRMRASQA